MVLFTEWSRAAKVSDYWLWHAGRPWSVRHLRHELEPNKFSCQSVNNYIVFFWCVPLLKIKMINEHVPEAITVRTAIKRAWFIIFPQQNLFIAISGCYVNDNDNSGFSFTRPFFFSFFFVYTWFDEITIWFFYKSTDRSLTNDTISNDTRYIFHDRSEKNILWYLLVSNCYIYCNINIFASFEHFRWSYITVRGRYFLCWPHQILCWPQVPYVQWYFQWRGSIHQRGGHFSG